VASPATKRIKPQRLPLDLKEADESMPIKIADDLPARNILAAEGVIVMGEADAVRQDIRPLRIGLLNLMPNKINTETQLARLIGATPLQVELTLVRITDHVSRNTSADHMASFYRPWSDVRTARFDGFIITGAPVERLPFAAATYWDELRRLLDWTQRHVHRSLTICWAAQAALHHFHGMPKHELQKKALVCSAIGRSHQPRHICAASAMNLPSRSRAGRRCARMTFPRNPGWPLSPKVPKPVCACSTIRRGDRCICSTDAYDHILSGVILRQN
jgi:hypothetical protein